MYHCSGKPAPPLLRRWGLNRSLALGAGGFALAWETATGRGLSGRSSAPCASLRSLPARLPPRCPALLPGHEKSPRKNPGAAIADGRAARGIAAPIAEILGRPSFERSCHPRRGPNGRVGAQTLRRHCITQRRETAAGYGAWNTVSGLCAAAQLGEETPPDPLFLSSVFRHIVCHICFHLTKVLCLGCSASRAGRARRKRPPPKKQFLKIKPQVRGLFFLHSSDQ